MRKANVILMALAVTILPTQAMLNGNAVFTLMWDIASAITFGAMAIQFHEYKSRVSNTWETFVMIQFVSYLVHFAMYNI